LEENSDFLGKKI